MSKPILSMILCSRNDQYMGNSLWRLQTTLNYVAKNAHELNREEDVEVLVADWGSDIPLRDALELSRPAAGIVKFAYVPPELARDLQKDSPFPEVLALNAAARRAEGQYIGRIDQDTLVGKQFLEIFFALNEGTRQLEVPLDLALLYSERRSIPYRFAVRCPSFWAVDRFLRWFQRSLRVEHPLKPNWPIYNTDVGIWLVHRNLWEECGGYDERLIYMNSMEGDMVHRLQKKYQLVDLGKVVNYDFSHLDHYHPWVPRRSSFYRKVNPVIEDPVLFHPNDENWGLIQYPVEIMPSIPSESNLETVVYEASRSRWPTFILLLLFTEVQVGIDRLGLSFRAVWRGLWNFVGFWRRRFRIALETIRGKSLRSWPRLLKQRWNEGHGGQIHE